MTESLYAAGGFYRRDAGPAAHFRTSVHVSDVFTDGILRLAAHVDDALGRPATFDLVDVGAGRGEFLTRVLARVGVVAPQLATRLRLVGVEVAQRPEGLADAIEWTARIPQCTGLLVANEWLDNIPIDVVVQTADGPRLLQVDDSGAERVGPPPTSRDAEWLSTWWPATDDARAEVGTDRDDAWAHAVSRVQQGVALAIDYGVRQPQLPALGTLTGFRGGRQVTPVPDASCDLTAHVQVDALAAAGARVAATPPLVTTQAEALTRLGVRPARPVPGDAHLDPRAYLTALAAVTSADALFAADGLGAFAWIVQPVGVPADTLLR